MRVCILIPVHNEEKTLPSLIESIRKKGLDVVVVNDGSSDASGQKAMDKGAYVLHHPIKQGKGASLKEGFQYILNKPYDGLITMDGDGQHDVGDIDAFLKAAETTGADVIVGNRMADARGMPPLRYLTNRFMSFLISCACKVSIADTQCGFRYITCQALKEIRLDTNDFEIETEMLMKASRAKMKIACVAIKTIYRNEESKVHPFKDTIRFFKYFFRELWTSKK
ncbi:MAG TPA: glycosyltransferase family 2 protein [Candidatus Omnitrophota bacterium]|nr:glycosyltransferase family 2 protein [Candidatus Omnitrophota bacterium]